MDFEVLKKTGWTSEEVIMAMVALSNRIEESESKDGSTRFKSLRSPVFRRSAHPYRSVQEFDLKISIPEGTFIKNRVSRFLLVATVVLLMNHAISIWNGN